MNNPQEEEDNLPLGTITLSQNDEVCLAIAVTTWDNVEITSTTLPPEIAEFICTSLIENTDYSSEDKVTILDKEFTLKFVEAGCEGDPVEPSEEKLAEIAEVRAEGEKLYVEARERFFAKWKGKHIELFNQIFEGIPDDKFYKCEEAGDFTYYECDEKDCGCWHKIASGIDYDTRNGYKVTFNTCDGDGNWECAGEWDDKSIRENCGSDILFDYWSHVMTDGYFIGLVRYHCYCAETGTDPIDEWFPSAKNKDDLAAAKDSLKYLKM